MISVLGPEGTTEYTAAMHLEGLIVRAWPEVVSDHRHDIKIVASAKCYGESPRDIDLIVFGNLAKQYSVFSGDSLPKQILIRSFCLAVEIKSHPPGKIRFVGNQVEVLYNEGWKPASEQSFKQQVSVRNYLSKEGIKPPFVMNLIWLRGIPESQLPAVRHNILGADATWAGFLRKIVENREPRRNRDGEFEVQALSYENRADDMARAAMVFTKEMKTSPLDRRKMEEVSRKVLRGQKYGEKIGEQLLIFRGRGGTGKTVHLLKIAHDLYHEKDKRVLILTYNKALVSDIRRTLTLMKIGDDVTERSVSIQTVHSFIHQILSGLGVLTADRRDFLRRYEHYKKEALELLRGAVEPGDIEALVKKNNAAFSWDYVFIDEAQDWPTDERDILFFVYGFRKFVLADGVDQMVRTHRHIDWRESIDRRETQIVTLKKSLRMKAGLCAFTEAFARQLGLETWDVEPNYDAPGGRVLVLEGSYSQHRRIHDEIIDRNSEHLNVSVDMLFCVPPSLVKESDEGETSSVVAEQFKEWGFKVWDGVSTGVRDSYPTELDQLRVVQYDSCRGLEGWTVVNLAFDQFYDYKVCTFEPTDEESARPFYDREHEARRHALRWLMIPLTRAIDTLVIQVSLENSFIKESLRAAARECEGIVEWRTIE